uniref:Ig-like domain-containing protein n=1 Tax=Ciona savignyi TaxID=51511 RepID=H2Z709_CIOSA
MMLRHPSYVILSMIWICVLATGVQCVKNDGEQNTFLDVLLERARRSDRITRATGDEAETTDDSDNSFLRIASPMRNHKATSGDKVHFKCKVESAANANLTFTWYKEDLLIDPNYDPRVTITKRPWGSRMRMIDLFTYDSGLYRCEASNGVKRVQASAHLTVSFKKPPPPGKNDKPKIIYQYGKCEKYKGVACA